MQLPCVDDAGRSADGDACEGVELTECEQEGGQRRSEEVGAGIGKGLLVEFDIEGPAAHDTEVAHDGDGTGGGGDAGGFDAPYLPGGRMVVCCMQVAEQGAQQIRQCCTIGRQGAGVETGQAQTHPPGGILHERFLRRGGTGHEFSPGLRPLQAGVLSYKEGEVPVGAERGERNAGNGVAPGCVVWPGELQVDLAPFVGTQALAGRCHRGLAVHGEVVEPLCSGGLQQVSAQVEGVDIEEPVVILRVGAATLDL